MKEVYLVKHAESQHHVDRVVGGWFDTSLTALGRSQAMATAAKLQTWIGDSVVDVTSSDLKRAAETAEIIARAFGTTPRLDPDLRELSYGSAGGKPDAWMKEHESFSPRTGDRMAHRSIPDGESRLECAARVYRATERLLASAHRTHVVVTHGFALPFVIAAWIRMPLEAAGYVNFAASTCGITHLREDDLRFNRTVRTLNDTSHLVGLG